jgi:hypothetical protein
MESIVVGTAHPRRFYVGMACIYVLIAFAGFTPTFWGPLDLTPCLVPSGLRVRG